MSAEPELYYQCRPDCVRPVARSVEFLTAAEFLADEQACRTLWDLVSTQFRTRSKFLAIWAGVRFVVVSRDDDGAADGFLLVNAPVNWQIDYVVVRPDRRGLGVAAALVTEAVNQAFRQAVPYVMLTSREALRPLYEGCGFEVVARAERPATAAPGHSPG
jgi:ribosomal protein S18 acetylase RimI-like enzyme